MTNNALICVNMVIKCIVFKDIAPIQPSQPHLCAWVGMLAIAIQFRKTALKRIFLKSVDAILDVLLMNISKYSISMV